MSLESDIKSQYAKFFTEGDYHVFVLMAEYYLQKAATLKTKDIDDSKAFKLLLRNVQKRLFIGVGCELLLKSFFLYSGYCINTPNRGYRHPNRPPYMIKDIPRENFNVDETFSFSQLIDQLPRTHLFAKSTLDEQAKIIKALKIAKVFRNKEGHVATLWHEYDSTNYSDIENGLVDFYRIAFEQYLEVHFAFERNEKSKFVVTSKNRGYR